MRLRKKDDEKEVPRRVNKKGAGRPERPIDWENFQKLCALQCTQSEIANFLKFDVGVLSHRVQKQYGEKYADVYKKYADEGKCSLRRHQFTLSKTNAAMAIWLGKQWLGQKENTTDIIISPEILNNFAAMMKQISDAKAIIEAEKKTITLTNQT